MGGRERELWTAGLCQTTEGLVVAFFTRAGAIFLRANQDGSQMRIHNVIPL